MKPVQPTASAAKGRRCWLPRTALALAAVLVATLVGCGTGPGGVGADTTPPTLALSGVRDGEIRADGELALDVFASDPSAVASVTWSSDHSDGSACTSARGDAYACGPVPPPPSARPPSRCEPETRSAIPVR